jgi:ribosome-binding factor A
MPRRFSQKPPEQVAADRGPEDGMDPKEFFRKSSARGPGRKVMQLCSQVQESLYWILGSQCGDESLALLQVLSVEPAPDSTRLLVTLKLSDGMTMSEALERLQEASKAIRSEVANSIHRKKAPDLVYRLV